MNDGPNLGASACIDELALKVQEFHRAGKLSGNQPLLRIDNRPSASQAPFQFDAVTGRLHRRGCPAIPKRSASALYAYWHIEDADQRLACPRCKPVLKDDRPSDPEFVSDLLYGVLSIVAQFGEVLRERGQEYRQSSEGRDLHTQLGGLYRGLGTTERNAVQAVMSSLTELAETIRKVEHGLNGANGRASDDKKGDNPKPRRSAPAAPRNGQN